MTGVRYVEDHNKFQDVIIYISGEMTTPWFDLVMRRKKKTNKSQVFFPDKNESKKWDFS